MGITEKGKKGFQTTSDKRIIRKSYRLTEGENKRLEDYLKENDIPHAEFIRNLLKDIIQD